jgi:hypothetical protein
MLLVVTVISGTHGGHYVAYTLVECLHRGRQPFRFRFRFRYVLHPFAAKYSHWMWH